MNRATTYGLSLLGILVLIRCGGTDSPSTGTGGAGGTSVTSTGLGGTAGSTAGGGTTSPGFGGFAPITGGAANTGGLAGTPGVGGVPGGVLPDAGIGIPAFDAGLGNINFDAAGFTFDAAAFRFDGALACPANQPNSGGFCFSANQACPYGSVTCTCTPPDGGLAINRWSCQ